MSDVTREEARMAREALDEWRAAERALHDARVGREFAQQAADTARLAAQSATRTQEAATAAYEAAKQAEETARLTGEAARALSITADDDLLGATVAEQDAVVAEAAAHDRHRETSDAVRGLIDGDVTSPSGSPPDAIDM
jgi:hypothetical protein